MTLGSSVPPFCCVRRFAPTWNSSGTSPMNSSRTSDASSWICPSRLASKIESGLTRLDLHRLQRVELLAEPGTRRVLQEQLVRDGGDELLVGLEHPRGA